MPTKQEISELQKRVKNLAESARKQIDACTDEQKTIQYLIIPFIRSILGYNTDKHEEAEPQFIADPKGQGGQKVDYALKHKGKAIILVEAKKYQSANPLNDNDIWGQLLSYFLATPTAQVGVLTNGTLYYFYSDVKHKRYLDKEPFLKFDLFNYTDKTVEGLACLKKDELGQEELEEKIRELQHTVEEAQRIDKEIEDLSVDISKLFARRAEIEGYSRNKQDEERLQKSVKDALQQVMEAEVGPRKVDVPIPDVPRTKAKGPPANLIEMRLGDETIVSNRGHKAIVKGPKMVEFEKQLYSLKDLTQRLFQPPGAFQPIGFWTYDGEKLTERYKRLQKGKAS